MPRLSNTHRQEAKVMLAAGVRGKLLDIWVVPPRLSIKWTRGSVMPDHAQANELELHHQTRTVSYNYVISNTEFLRRHK